MFYYKIIHCIIYIKYDIEEYERLNKIKSDYKKVYWITGYKEGGAIANVLAAKLRDMGQQVYGYTFGSPMTIYNNSDEKGYTRTGYSVRYDSIFNIVNEDDPYAFLMSQELGFSRYGKTCLGDGRAVSNYDSSKIKSAKESIITKFNYMFKNTENKDDKIVVKYKNDTRKEAFRTVAKENTYKNIQEFLMDFMRVINTERNNIANGFKLLDIRTKMNKSASRIKELVILLADKKSENKNEWIYNVVKRAGEEDVYYHIAENIDNANIVNIVNLTDNARLPKRPIDYKYMTMEEALKEMGEWYSKNVYTYKGYSDKDFTRNGNPVTFAERFQHDYDKASSAAKKEREKRVDEYNKDYQDNPYLIENFTKTKDYKTELESFKGGSGEHAIYPCELLDDPNYMRFKDVGDSCSAMTLATMYYATKGAMDEYDCLNINELGGGILASITEKKEEYQALKKIGFEKIPVKNGTFDELQSGDILVSSSHYEFFYITEDGKKTSFGWGSVKDKFPNKNNSLIENPGKPYFFCKGFNETEFSHIYRLTKGGSNE